MLRIEVCKHLGVEPRENLRVNPHWLTELVEFLDSVNKLSLHVGSIDNFYLPSSDTLRIELGGYHQLLHTCALGLRSRRDYFLYGVSTSSSIRVDIYWRLQVPVALLK